MARTPRQQAERMPEPAPAVPAQAGSQTRPARRRWPEQSIGAARVRASDDAGQRAVLRLPGTWQSASRRDTGLPGVRITLPPGASGRPEAVSISTFREDGWLNGTARAGTGRRRSGPGAGHHLPVPAPGSGNGAPPAGVAAEWRRAAPAAANRPPAGAPAAAAAAIQAEPDIVAHVQRTGDVGGLLGDWIGTRGSGAWIEGFAITPPRGLRRRGHRIPGACSAAAGCRPGSRAASSAAAAAWRCPCWAQGAAEGRRGAPVGMQLRRDLHRRQQGRPGQCRRDLRGREPRLAGSLPHRAAPSQHPSRAGAGADRRRKTGTAGATGRPSQTRWPVAPPRHPAPRCSVPPKCSFPI